MLWKKEKYIVSIHGGKGTCVANPEHGLIQQLVICPTSKDTIWSMDILDRDNDCIYSVKDHEGQLSDREGIPVGKDQTEKLTIKFYELTKNEDIKVIFNIKEVR